MIRLVGPISIYRSEVFSHPQRTGTQYFEYILNHNIGVYPDNSRLMIESDTGGFFPFYDLDRVGSTNYGENARSNSTENTYVSRVSRISSSTVNIRFHLFWH